MSCYINHRRMKKRLNTFLKKISKIIVFLDSDFLIYCFTIIYVYDILYSQ